MSLTKDLIPSDNLLDGGSEPIACSVFVAKNNENHFIMGRNFDYFTGDPALLLFTKPSKGYASVSMVDISYVEKFPPHLKKLGLMAAPYVPLDGMNECGLCVAIMSVPNSESENDPGKVSITHNNAIRLLLDYAANVNDAVKLLKQYNIWLEHGGIHYLIADSSCRSAIVEFVDGEMKIIPNDQAWQAATNFMLSNSEKGGSGQDRYNIMLNRLVEKNGVISNEEAMNILMNVASEPENNKRSSTLWSLIYDMSMGDIVISMGANFEKRYDFNLKIMR